MNLLKNQKIRQFFDLDTPVTYHNIIEIEVLIMVVLMFRKFYLGE